MIYVFLADGFEEVEALAPVDVLRRAKVDVKTVGVTGKTVLGSHKIAVNCDLCAEDISTDGLQGIILPGGMPGTVNLEKNETVMSYLDYAASHQLVIGAICAAPSILGHKGLLEGKNATCFTGFEPELKEANVIDRPAVCDGNIVTGWGAGGALDFAFCYLEVLTGDKQCAENLRRSMRYPL